MILEPGFSNSGFICELFNIFKNNISFLSGWKKQELCEICGKVYEYNDDIFNLYIIINDGNIKFRSVEQIILYKLINLIK